MKLFVRRSDGALVTFEGMTEEEVLDMLAAQDMTCEFLDEATYSALASQEG